MCIVKDIRGVFFVIMSTYTVFDSNINYRKLNKPVNPHDFFHKVCHSLKNMCTKVEKFGI